MTRRQEEPSVHGRVRALSARVLAAGVLVVAVAGCGDQESPAGTKQQQSTGETNTPNLQGSVTALDTRARRMFPRTYTGLWLGDLGDNEGESVAPDTPIHLAFTTAPQTSASIVAAEYPFPESIVPESAEFSREDLVAVRDDITEEMDRPDGEIEVGPSDIDLTRNRVVLFIEETDPNLERHLQETYGGAVITQIAGPIELYG